ncbi:MAG: lamin tail domain-containing protein [Anaerolineae bacterium]
MKKSLVLLIVLSSVVVTILILLSSTGARANAARAAPYTALDVVINEVAWSGTACSAYDEWIELYNNAAVPIDLAGWTLQAADGSPSIDLEGTIPAQGFFLLERTDDDTVSDIPADLIYSGALSNDGERLQLLDASAAVVDTANADDGPWPGGLSEPRYTMERIDPVVPDDDANWGTNDGLTRNGADCNGDPLNGTPRAPNSVWGLPGADLHVDKIGPDTILPGAIITYTIALSNTGELPAETVYLTDVLPSRVEYLAHSAPYPLYQPITGTLVWDLGTVPTATSDAPITFTLAGQVESAAAGILLNVVTATTNTPGDPLADNHDEVVTVVGDGPATPPILIEALYYDGYAYDDEDEAFRLLNVSAGVVDIGGWTVTDGAARGVTRFPPGSSLAPGQAIWCTRNASAFEAQFGFKSDFEAAGADPDVPDLEGSWPPFNNLGDLCRLQDAEGGAVDALVYTGGDTAIPGWYGPSVEPWSPSSYFGAEGQILYRKRDQATGVPLADTDTAVDWAQDPADHVYGRKAQYPGWDLDDFFWTARLTETAVLTVAVGPDHLLETVHAQIERAQESIQIQAYTFESAVLAQALVERLGAGVEVTLLLEGGPAGGIEPAQRWICDQIRRAGGQVYFMTTQSAPARYRFQHAKILLVDDRLVLVGSENLNPSGMPADDKGDGTAGRRGVYLITDAPGVVSRIQALLEADRDPDHHQDLATCDDVPEFCTGPEPLSEPEWTSYTVAFSEPLTVEGEFAFEVIQSPENSLRTVDSLLGMVGQAGEGDVLLVEQLYEHLHWGPGSGDPETDPNLRLQAYLDAARRGATVRVLLNSFTFAGDENGNRATIAYLRSIARSEGLDLQARLGNPTSLGLHNKMVLARIEGRGYVHVGSINGSEVSSKVNRELALQVQSDGAYQYLQEVFDHDWLHSPLLTYLPLVVKNHVVPSPADHLLISEVYYNTVPKNEWVEIHNPTRNTVDLSAYKIGDAAQADDYEGMYRFPAGTAIPSGRVLVVAVTATGFREAFPGLWPDFEIFDSEPAVPNLLEDPVWGQWDWGLGNDGDEVLLLDGRYRPVDAVVYGQGSYPPVVPHPGGISYGHSLEREPASLDTDDCSVDFRDWPFPSPGELP